MTRHRLELEGSHRGAPTIKRGLYDGLFSKERSLTEVLGADPATLASLRELAHAHYHSGQWAQCVAVVEGLHALDAPELWDPIMLSRCHQELGDPERAVICARIGEELLALALYGRSEGASS